MDKKSNENAGELFERLVEVVEKLRAPGGCPWDREQTHKSLRPYLIEEVYEVVDSIDNSDYFSMREELGDVLLHILFHSDIERESDRFDICDVIQTLTEKLIRRHPHVFGDVKVANSDEVLHNWENIKLRERQKKSGNASLLDGIPKSMSALLIAQRMQEKASRIGFDWDNIADVWGKVEEEIGELKELLDSGDENRIEDELGDILFALSNLARFLKTNSEMALRRTNEKFSSRFRYIEQKLRENNIENPTHEIMDKFWDEAKQV